MVDHGAIALSAKAAAVDLVALPRRPEAISDLANRIAGVID